MVETFYDLDEAVDAVEAVRSVSSLPIVALLTFDEGAETIAGITADEAAARLSELDVAAIGANHGAGLLAALAALDRMGSNGKPLAALPNVGLASLAGGRVIYPHATPEYFAEFAAHARDLGARLIGGCCGTTPAEIAAIRSAVEEERQARAPLQFDERELVVALGGATRDGARASAARRGVGRDRAARSAARRKQQRPARGRPRAARVRTSRVGRHQRQRDSACRHELTDCLRAYRARGRDRDDSAPDDTRLVGDGTRVDAPR